MGQGGERNRGLAFVNWPPAALRSGCDIDQVDQLDFTVVVRPFVKRELDHHTAFRRRVVDSSAAGRRPAIVVVFRVQSRAISRSAASTSGNCCVVQQAPLGRVDGAGNQAKGRRLLRHRERAHSGQRTRTTDHLAWRHASEFFSAGPCSDLSQRDRDGT